MNEDLDIHAMLKLVTGNREHVPLHDDLLPFVSHEGPLGYMVKHPYVVTFMNDLTAAKHINALYFQKKTQVENAYIAKNWFHYVRLHERAFRVHALEKSIDAGLTGPDYWEIIRYVWIDSESIHQTIDLWKELWKSDIPDRIRHVMNDAEQDAYASLPDKVEIYRGYLGAAAVNGMSWTTDRDKAVWFARRFSSFIKEPMFVASGVISKTNILAYLLGRSEEEIVAVPEDIENIKVTKLRRTKR